MDRGSNKHGSKLDDEIGQETEALERSGREARVEEAFEKEDASAEGTPSGHRISGSGSSADEYSYKDWGEVGGASHPKPKDGASDRAKSQAHSREETA